MGSHLRCHAKGVTSHFESAAEMGEHTIMQPGHEVEHKRGKDLGDPVGNRAHLRNKPSKEMLRERISNGSLGKIPALPSGMSSGFLIVVCGGGGGVCKFTEASFQLKEKLS